MPPCHVSVPESGAPVKRPADPSARVLVRHTVRWKRNGITHTTGSEKARHCSVAATTRGALPERAREAWTQHRAPPVVVCAEASVRSSSQAAAIPMPNKAIPIAIAKACSTSSPRNAAVPGLDGQGVRRLKRRRPTRGVFPSGRPLESPLRFPRLQRNLTHPEMPFSAPFYRWRPHPWHGLEPGFDVLEVVQADIEMTPFDLIKDEADKITAYPRVDRPQRGSSQPPTLNGFVPRTCCGDRVSALSQSTRGTGVSPAPRACGTRSGDAPGVPPAPCHGSTCTGKIAGC